MIMIHYDNVFRVTIWFCLVGEPPTTTQEASTLIQSLTADQTTIGSFSELVYSQAAAAAAAAQFPNGQLLTAPIHPHVTPKQEEPNPPPNSGGKGI